MPILTSMHREHSNGPGAYTDGFLNPGRLGGVLTVGQLMVGMAESIPGIPYAKMHVEY